MTPAERQWELNRHNFAGRWCGSSSWYLRQPGGADAPLDLSHPSRIIDDTCYAISFSDDDHGIWDGRGLLFAPEGRRRLELTRQHYNSTGQCWQFDGAGGQSSLSLDPSQPRWGHEINLFAGRSRSMLVLLWGQRPLGETRVWVLESVGAVGFRCSLGPNPEQERPVVSKASELLEQQRGWPGTIECLHNPPRSGEPSPPEPCATFAPETFATGTLTQGFADGLVCSVAEQLPQSGFSLQAGCRFGPDRFDQITLVFERGGRLNRWERRRFRRDG